MIIALAIAFLILLVFGALWVIGFDIVKEASDQHLIWFFIVLTVMRMICVLSFAVLYIMYFAETVEEAKTFAIAIVVMYTVMLAVTLILKH